MENSMNVDKVKNRANGEFAKYSAAADTVARDLGERAGEMAATVSDTASAYLENGRQFTRKNPAGALMAAAAIGLLAGSVLTMALRRSN